MWIHLNEKKVYWRLMNEQMTISMNIGKQQAARYILLIIYRLIFINIHAYIQHTT